MGWGFLRSGRGGDDFERGWFDSPMNTVNFIESMKLNTVVSFKIT